MAKLPPSSNPPALKISSDYLLVAFTSWLLPGAGHWCLGYRVRGSVLAASILGLFWMGQALAVPTEGDWKPMAVSRKISPVFFACQAGNGFSTLLSNQIWGAPRHGNNLEPLDRTLPRYLNLAILFTSVSGLLNYLLIVHILDPRTWAQAAADKLARKTTANSASRAAEPSRTAGAGGA